MEVFEYQYETFYVVKDGKVLVSLGWRAYPDNFVDSFFQYTTQGEVCRFAVSYGSKGIISGRDGVITTAPTLLSTNVEHPPQCACHGILARPRRAQKARGIDAALFPAAARSPLEPLRRQRGGKQTQGASGRRQSAPVTTDL